MTTDTYETYRTIGEIKAANARIGHFFFEPASMRFFSSKIASQTVYGEHFFITSEQVVASDSTRFPRMYTIRSCYQGKCDTVGEFQQYSTLTEAKRAARSLAAFNRNLP